MGRLSGNGTILAGTTNNSGTSGRIAGGNSSFQVSSGSTPLQDYVSRSNKMDTYNKLQNLKDLNYQDQIKSVRDGFKYGFIDKPTQLTLIKAVVASDQEKQPKPQLNPIAQFGAGVASTAQRIANTADLFATGVGGALATALQNNTVGKNAANAESMKRLQDISNRKTVTGENGTWINPTQAGKGDLLGPIASTVGEVTPWILPYGAMSKFAGGVTAPLAERAIASTAGKAITKVVPSVADKLIASAVKLPLNAAINAPAFGLSNALTQYGTTGKVDPLQVAQQGLIGGAMVAGGEFIGDIIRKGPVPQLEKLKADRLKVADNLMPELTQAQADKLGPQKIGITGESTTTQISTRSPLKPGIQQISETNKIGVRVGNKMTDGQYTKDFNAISKSYDNAIKQLENEPLARQKILQTAIDNQHSKALLDLDNRYLNPIFQEPKYQAQQVGKTTVSETSTRGGKQLGRIDTNTKIAPKLETQLNKTNTTPQVSKTVETPKLAEVPVVGEQKVTGSALKVEAKAVEAGFNERFPDMATYSSGSSKETSLWATDTVNNNPKVAWDILEGKVGADDLQKGTMFTAMDKKLTELNDFAGQQRLAKSKTNVQFSGSGQLLGAKGYNADPYSAVDAMTQVSKDKIAGLERRTNIKVDVAKQEAGNMVAKVTKIPTKKDWSSFIESIKC